MLATLALEAVPRPRLAVRDQVGRLPRPGRRRRRQGPAPGPATSRTPRPTSRACSRRRPGSTPGRPSSTARSSRSTTTAAPTSRSSRTKLGEPGVGRARLPGRSTCSTSTAGRCSTSRSRIASACSGACSATTRGSASRRHVDGEGLAFFEAAKASGLEGIVAKLRRSRYEPGRRSNAWLKIKIRPEQELVVGGWTPGEGNARDLGALVVGVYEDGKLRFAGKVGSGFTGAGRKELLEAARGRS